MRKYKTVSMILCIAMLLTPLDTASASLTGKNSDGDNYLIPKVREYSAFIDVKNSWCEEYVRVCYETGLLNGMTESVFEPNGTLTEAQRLVIGSRLHALLHGKTMSSATPGEAWWMPAARYFITENGDTESDPMEFAFEAQNDTLRVTFAHQMAWSTPMEKLPAINDVVVDDIPDYDASMQDAGKTTVLNLYRAGILNGIDQWGTFDPRGTLTRGQAAAMLARIIDPSLRLEFELSPFDLCRDVFQMEPDTTLITVDDVSITLDQFCGTVAEICLQHTDQESFQAALMEEARLDVATDQLAKKKGVSLTMISNYGEIMGAQYSGESETSQKWRFDHDTLLSLLGFHSYPNFLSTDLIEEHQAVAEALVVNPDPILREMNLIEIQKRLNNSPFC